MQIPATLVPALFTRPCTWRLLSVLSFCHVNQETFTSGQFSVEDCFRGHDREFYKK